LVVLLFSFMLGLSLLATAAWRSRLTHWWVPLTVGISVIGYLAGSNTSKWADAVAGVPVAIAYGYIGIRILRTTHTDWAGQQQSDAPILETELRPAMPKSVSRPSTEALDPVFHDFCRGRLSRTWRCHDGDLFAGRC
jgi:hypothetical protein